MSALIAACAVRTTLGDGAQTFAALLEGRSGVSPLRHVDGLAGTYCYQIDEEGLSLRASRWLGECAREAVQSAGIDPGRQRTIAVVGTGLRELWDVERAMLDGGEIEPDKLHFGPAVRRAVPGVAEVITLSGACSASGHALALAQDLIELGEADVVIAAGADSITESMLATIDRVAGTRAEQLRPFDTARSGALLGEGAAVAVVVPDRPGVRGVARLLATGMSCDAHHETAAHPEGVRRAVRDALARCAASAGEVDLVVAHGTGTAINDPLECQLLREVYRACSERPLVTAIKGATGHTSGAAALMSVDVAARCLREQTVPPIVGLREAIPQAADLALVRERPRTARLRRAQVNAFGFGGVNSVTLLEAA